MCSVIVPWWNCFHYDHNSCTFIGWFHCLVNLVRSSRKWLLCSVLEEMNHNLYTVIGWFHWSFVWVSVSWWRWTMTHPCYVHLVCISWKWLLCSVVHVVCCTVKDGKPYLLSTWLKIFSDNLCDWQQTVDQLFQFFATSVILDSPLSSRLVILDSP